MILIITYDLRTPKDYHDFYEAIKAQGQQGKWWHYMSSTWLLSTTKTIQEVFDAIHPHLDKQDFVFVCELAANYQGWLPKPAWDWIRSELVAPPNPFLEMLAGTSGLANPAPSLPSGIRTLSDLLGKKTDKS
jgi:hypothetical protein